MSLQIRIREVNLTIDSSHRMVSSTAEAWQRSVRLLAAFGKEDHKVEVSCRNNAFGYVAWYIQVFGKGNCIAWRLPNEWDTWEGVETLLIEWLTETYDGQLPMCLHDLKQAMRSLPGVPLVMTEPSGF